MAASPAPPIADRLASAAPWWIALGVAGVTLGVFGSPVPMLACLTLIGLGADADLARRFREALAAEGTAGGLAAAGGLLRGLHAVMYAGLVLLAWGSLLDVADQTGGAGYARWWLTADVLVAALLLAGYLRLQRRV